MVKDVMFEEWRLTGRVGWRRGWFGRVVLLVQERLERGTYRQWRPTGIFRWRKATWRDMQTIVGVQEIKQ